MSNRRYYLSDEPEKLDSGKLLYISYSAYEGEWPSIPHTHFLSEIFFVTKGEGKFFVENEEIIVKENSLVVINPNVAHYEISNKNERLEYYVLGISNIVFDFNYQNENKDIVLRNFYVCDFSKSNKKILFALEEMLNELQNKSINYLNIVKNLYEIILIDFLRISGQKPFYAESKQSPKECSQIKRYIESNYPNEITLDFLAEMTHLNKYYLSHAFADTYGISPINYLINVRIQASKELLTSTDYTIGEISSSCGFSSQSYFCQSFKKNMLITPAEFRKLSKKNFDN